MLILYDLHKKKKIISFTFFEKFKNINIILKYNKLIFDKFLYFSKSNSISVVFFYRLYFSTYNKKQNEKKNYYNIIIYVFSL